jgi:hypothetical protein
MHGLQFTSVCVYILPVISTHPPAPWRGGDSKLNTWNETDFHDACRQWYDGVDENSLISANCA